MKDVVIPGLSWVIGDGKRIRFWKDSWMTQKSLLEDAITEIPAALAGVKIREIWQRGVGWMLQQIASYVTDDMKLQLAAIVVDDITGAKDRVAWGHTQNGKFTVTSAYVFLTRDSTPRSNMQALFARVWHVLAPERTRTFLWLVARKAIMTNMER